MTLPLLESANIVNKTVFLRADLDVPLKVQSYIEDDTRLVKALPTIDFLLKKGAKVVIAGHLGRPNPVSNESGIMNQEFSLKSIAVWFGKRFKIYDLGFKIKEMDINNFPAWQIRDDLFLLENLRFYKGEETNDRKFSKKLASLADVYVNDAFAMSHRNHASIVGITKYLPYFAGFHLQKEIETLSLVMKNPERPLVVIVGGKKIETKLPLVHKMHAIADYVLVGGKIAQESKVLLKEQHARIIGRKSVLLVADSNTEGSDITEQDAENFLQIIALGKTIIWNGSMGIINSEFRIQNSELDTERGTRMIAKGVIKSGAYTVVGGGDTVEFLNKLGILNKFSFASTGGGAMLSYLSGEKLPGLEALKH